MIIVKFTLLYADVDSFKLDNNRGHILWVLLGIDSDDQLAECTSLGNPSDPNIFLWEK